MTGAQTVPSILFEDVSERSGVDFRGPHSKEKRFILESVSGGVALLDLDGDGWLDLFLVDSLTVATAGRPELARSTLYRNLGDGRFEDVTDAAGIPRLGWGVGVCAGDADGDGEIDLYVTGVERNHLLRHLGGLRFEDVTKQAGVRGGGWSTGCGFADADRDGDLDLFVARYLDLRLDDLPPFGEGEICRYRGVPVQCGPRGLPGKSDLYFRNDGSGRFEEVAKAAGLHDGAELFGLGVTWLDIERDGWPDLYVANDTGANYLYINQRDGTFEESAHVWGVAVTEDGKEQGSMGIAFGDYLNDGWLSLFVTNFSEEYNALYRNRKGEYFSDASFRARLATDNLRYVGWGTAFFDADNDGWLDLVWVNGHVYPQMDEIELEASAPYLQRSMLYRNARDGTFVEVRGGPLGHDRAARGLAVGDIDNDGRLDLVTTDLDAEARILRNVSPESGHWLTVELQQPALGAYLVAQAGGLTLTRQVTSGSSYLSQHPLRQHFGLGDIKRVEKIDVTWPGGSRSSHGPFEADRLVRLEQPAKSLFEPTSAGTVSQDDGPAMQIDHVILAIRDLESGMREFEDLTGVKPVYGGSHPDRDTHNAIAPLSGGMYVEILAPKDGLDAIPDFFKNFHQLTLVGFAISVRDIERVESTVRALGLDTNGTESGSRTTPNGGLLAWRLLLINEPESFMNPFFISWSDDSQHPSTGQRPRCELESLKLITPHKKQIERILTESGGEIQFTTIVEGPRALTIELKTPNGRIAFES